jgi:hypothetical protein
LIPNDREAMTKLLEEALEAARTLPSDIQDDIARVVMVMAGKDEPVIQMTAEEEASFTESRAQAARGEFASDERMRGIWSKDL